MTAETRARRSVRNWQAEASRLELAAFFEGERSNRERVE
jgi:hypothetical protein